MTAPSVPTTGPLPGLTLCQDINTAFGLTFYQGMASTAAFGGTVTAPGTISVTNLSGQTDQFKAVSSGALSAGYRALNTSQEWGWGVRSDQSNSFVIRDQTNNADVFSLAVSTGVANFRNAITATAANISNTSGLATQTLNGGTGTAQGSNIIFQQNGTTIGSLGNAAALTGSGTSQDVMIQAQGATNNLNLNSVGGQVNIQVAGVTYFAINQSGQVITRTPGAVQGGFKNLKITNGGTPNTQVEVTADALALYQISSGFYQTVQGVNLTISTGSTGANGLDTGSVANSTWYSVWVISNGSTVSGLLSTSATSPSLPSGYVFAARVGWVITDSSSNLKRTLQYGRRTNYVVVSGSNTAALPSMASGTTSGTAAVSVSSFVPSTASRITCCVGTGSGAGTIHANVWPNNGYSGTGSSTNVWQVYITDGLTATVELQLESSNVYWNSVGSSGNGLACYGWEDNI